MEEGTEVEEDKDTGRAWSMVFTSDIFLFRACVHACVVFYWTFFGYFLNF